MYLSYLSYPEMLFKQTQSIELELLNRHVCRISRFLLAHVPAI